MPEGGFAARDILHRLALCRRAYAFEDRSEGATLNIIDPHNQREELLIPQQLRHTGIQQRGFAQARLGVYDDEPVGQNLVRKGRRLAIAPKEGLMGEIVVGERLRTWVTSTGVGHISLAVAPLIVASQG